MQYGIAIKKEESKNHPYYHNSDMTKTSDFPSGAGELKASSSSLLIPRWSRPVRQGRGLRDTKEA